MKYLRIFKSPYHVSVGSSMCLFLWLAYFFHHPENVVSVQQDGPCDNWNITLVVRPQPKERSVSVVVRTFWEYNNCFPRGYELRLLRLDVDQCWEMLSPIDRLYCSGTGCQRNFINILTVDSNGTYTFEDLDPGFYCVQSIPKGKNGRFRPLDSGVKELLEAPPDYVTSLPIKTKEVVPFYATKLGIIIIVISVISALSLIILVCYKYVSYVNGVNHEALVRQQGSVNGSSAFSAASVGKEKMSYPYLSCCMFVHSDNHSGLEHSHASISGDRTSTSSQNVLVVSGDASDQSSSGDISGRHDMVFDPEDVISGVASNYTQPEILLLYLHDSEEFECVIDKYVIFLRNCFEVKVTVDKELTDEIYCSPNWVQSKIEKFWPRAQCRPKIQNRLIMLVESKGAVRVQQNNWDLTNHNYDNGDDYNGDDTALHLNHHVFERACMNLTINPQSIADHSSLVVVQFESVDKSEELHLVPNMRYTIPYHLPLIYFKWYMRGDIDRLEFHKWARDIEKDWKDRGNYYQDLKTEIEKYLMLDTEAVGDRSYMS